MTINVQLQAALIGALGGLVGGGVTAGANHFFGLKASRQDLLQKERRTSYVEWAEVRQLSRQSHLLRADGKHDEADKLFEEFDFKGRQVMGKIATYGGQDVVKSISTWYRIDEPQACISPSLTEEEYTKERRGFEAEIRVHQAMRRHLMPTEPAVSDADMSILLFQCEMPTAR